MAILYLDFDGVLHPADVRVTREEPSRPRVYVRGRPTDLPLFEHMGLLEHLMDPFPGVQIVLATSWGRMLGYRFAVEQLTPALRERVIGATWHPDMKEVPPTRFDAIASDAAARKVTRWLALDDDRLGWPEEERHRLVAPTNPMLALAEPGVAEELTAMLGVLCAGGPLEALSRADKVPSTMERLFGFRQ